MPLNRGDGTLLCVGTSHRVASVPFIERASRGAERYRRAWIETTRDSAEAQPILELVVLATCNRVEVWAAVAREFADATGLAIRDALTDGEGDTTAVYVLRDHDAVRHLCRVAVGLESMVVGEPQIAGQVARAFEAVLHANGGAPVLGSAARTARLASRRARSETAIGRGPASISTVAVHLATERLGGLDGARVLVIGAGKIGHLTCRALRAAGASLTIVSRTLARAEQLADRTGASALPLQALPQAIAGSDVVFASTSSPRPIIDAALLDRALVPATGTGRRLLLVDIAVPRNVADDVTAMDGVSLIGIDDLRREVCVHLDERRGEIPKAEAIIEEVLAEVQRGDGATLTVIGDLRRRAERIRRRAVQRTLDHLGDTDRATRERIEHLSRALVNRLLHDPTIRLRSAADRGAGDEYARLARELFALDPDGGNGR